MQTKIDLLDFNASVSIELNKSVLIFFMEEEA